MQSARCYIAEHYNLHGFEFDAERLEFIDSLLADHKYLFPVAEDVADSVHNPNPMQRVSKDANKCPASAVLPGGSKPGVYLLQISSSGG
jgi:hypothetical protein